MINDNNTILESYVPFNDLFSFDGHRLLSLDIGDQEGKETEEIKTQRFSTFFEIKDEKEEDISNKVPNHYPFKEVKEIIIKNIPNVSKEIRDSLVYDDFLRKLENSLIYRPDTQKKRKKIKTKFSDDTTESNILGRKRLNDYSKRRHSKYSFDNIIKRVKLYLFDNVLLFLNKTLTFFLDKQKLLSYSKLIKKPQIKGDDLNNLLKPLDYKFIGGIKKQLELSIFRMPLKDLFAKDISPKYKTFYKDANRTIIAKVLEDEKENDNIMFAFNLTFGDWLDIFLFKNDLKSNNIFGEEKMKDIIKIFHHFDNLLEEVYQNNQEKKYFSTFIYLIYNYERWFYLKRGRNRVSKKNNKE